jgi:tRNA threonylcarbamoyladenosine biosynthesis protein TsaB
MTNLLAIDTSTEACSAALSVDDRVSARFRLAPREHSQLLLPMLDELLEEAGLAVTQLDALAFGCGPGAFTGVRIAAGVIQGIALGADLPVVSVSSLAALAQGAWREFGAGRVLAAIDARMGEVYWGLYEAGAAGLMTPVAEERVAAPDDVTPPQGGGWIGAGSGWDTYHEVLAQRLGDAVEGWQAQRFPHAHDVAVLGVRDFAAGLGVPAEQALPHYIRDRVVQVPRAGKA